MRCGGKIVEPDRPQTIRRMRIACWIPKATNTHSEYVILTAFPLQQWLQERASMLRYTYIACIIYIYIYIYIYTLGHYVGKRIFHFFKAPRSALAKIPSPIQCVLEAISPGVKRPWCEADLSSAQCWSQEWVDLYLHSPYALSACTRTLSFRTGQVFHIRLFCKAFWPSLGPNQ
jgi:hypothetical protein